VYHRVRCAGQVITKRMSDMTGVSLAVVLGRGRCNSSILSTYFIKNVCTSVSSTYISQVSTPVSRQSLGSAILDMDNKKRW